MNDYGCNFILFIMTMLYINKRQKNNEHSYFIISLYILVLIFVTTNINLPVRCLKSFTNKNINEV